MKENLMTVQEVAAHLHLSPHTIYKWIEKRRIPVIRLGYCVRFSNVRHSGVGGEVIRACLPHRPEIRGKVVP